MSQAIKVLFVEDNTDDVVLAERSLKRAGLEIESQIVQDEERLIGALESWQPDVILSDFALPTLNGPRAFEITQRLAPDVPFIFLSGGVPGRLAADALARGAMGFVEKGDEITLSRLVASCARLS